MSVPLSQLLSDTTEKTRNSTTGALDNSKRTRAINRVLQDLQDFADWEFTKRTKEFDLIDGVNEYSLENYIGCVCLDNDGSTNILDFKNPHDLRITDRAHRPFEYKEAKEIRSNINRGKRFNQIGIDQGLLIINYPRQVSSQIHNCDSLTANGTVAASVGASNLTIDEVVFDEGDGALNFDATAATSLVITFTGFTALDLESFQNKSHVVLKAWLPTITNFSSIKIRLGSSASDYWEKTETQPAGNRSVQTGKNLFAFSWADATESGSPDFSLVDYLQITITYSSAVTATDFRIDDVRIGLSVPMALDYYSLAMVKDADGDYQLEFNADSVTQTDELLGPESRRCVVEGTAHELFGIIGGKSERDRTDTLAKYEEKKMELLKRAGHRIRRPSRVLNFPGR